MRVLLHEVSPEFSFVPEALEVPPVVPSHFLNAFVLAKPLALQREVLRDHREALSPRRRGRNLAGLQKGPGVPEDPRVTDGPTSDHDGVDARLIEHLLDLLRTGCVAISDERDVP